MSILFVAQGLGLYTRSLARGKTDLRMVSFSGSLGYGHSGMTRHPGLAGILASFQVTLAPSLWSDLLQGGDEQGWCRVAARQDDCAP